MTTTTSERELPTDQVKLRAFLPDAPTDSTVATILAGIRRLDAAIAVVHDLEQHGTVDRATVNALVEAAIDDDHLEVLAARLDPGNRAALTHRLAQLQAARSSAAHRHTRAEQTDPAHLAWRERCEQVRREWNIVMASEKSEDRFAGLVAFASRH